jgi:hypothetical protein
MTQGFTHLVLTRFNTAVGYAPSAKRLDSAWLQSRLSLFERYCLPSMAAQRDAAFQWIVFCDAGSPQWFHDKMASFEPLLKPMYIDGWLTDERIAGSLDAAGLVSAPYLITTRLDNDDALARGHLSMVQAEFEQQEREFLEFPVGIQSFRGHLYNVFWHSNPFLSLIEKVKRANRFTTVCCVRHDRVRTAGKIRSLVRPPQWLQLIHGENIGNSLRGWPRLQSRRSADFEVFWPAEEPYDSFPQRWMFTAAAYAERGKAWLSRHGLPA